MRLGERIKNSSLTDWLLTMFTGVLAAASIYQFTIMNGQLDEMRKEQRPWIKVIFDSDPLKALGAVGGVAHLVNKGKTPAKGIAADMLIERIKNGEQPKLDYSVSHVQFSQGSLFPDESADVHVRRLRNISSDTADSDLLTESEFDDFRHNRIFFIVYGTIRYTDFFGIDHWTKFCEFAGNGTATAKRCSDYNDVDSN